jgi:hypothetical protein
LRGAKEINNAIPNLVISFRYLRSSHICANLKLLALFCIPHDYIEGVLLATWHSRTASPSSLAWLPGRARDAVSETPILQIGGTGECLQVVMLPYRSPFLSHFKSLCRFSQVHILQRAITPQRLPQHQERSATMTTALLFCTSNKVTPEVLRIRPSIFAYNVDID